MSPYRTPGEPASVERLTSSLADVEEALRALSGATHHAADALIPPAGIDEAGATLRAGAECCRRVRDILASTIA